MNASEEAADAMQAERKQLRRWAASSLWIRALTWPGGSVTTVKWHIRHIFAKHGLSGQADLVRLALSLADGPGVRR